MNDIVWTCSIASNLAKTQSATAADPRESWYTSHMSESILTSHSSFGHSFEEYANMVLQLSSQHQHVSSHVQLQSK
jgi:hypothetical protein